MGAGGGVGGGGGVPNLLTCLCSPTNKTVSFRFCSFQ